MTNILLSPGLGSMLDDMTADVRRRLESGEFDDDPKSKADLKAVFKELDEIDNLIKEINGVKH